LTLHCSLIQFVVRISGKLSIEKAILKVAPDLGKGEIRGGGCCRARTWWVDFYHVHHRHLQVHQDDIRFYCRNQLDGGGASVSWGVRGKRGRG
jgi:hypothetical protein